MICPLILPCDKSRPREDWLDSCDLGLWFLNPLRLLQRALQRALGGEAAVPQPSGPWRACLAAVPAWSPCHYPVTFCPRAFARCRANMGSASYYLQLICLKAAESWCSVGPSLTGGRWGEVEKYLLPERRDLETQQLPAATLKMPEVQGMGMFSGCGSTDCTIAFTVPVSCLPGMLLFSKMFTQTLGSSFFSRRTRSKVYPYIFGALCVTWSKSLKSQFIQKGAQSFHQA